MIFMGLGRDKLSVIRGGLVNKELKEENEISLRIRKLANANGIGY